MLPSEFYKKRITKILKIDKEDKLKVVGWPHSDKLINNNLSAAQREDVIEKLGLNKGLKTVLYAPTYNIFGKGNLFPKSFGKLYETFENFCKEVQRLNINLIIKLHPLSVHLIRDKKLRQIAEKHNIAFVNSNADLYLDNFLDKLVQITDVLISSVSGIIVDFMFMDKPIIYLDPDEDDFKWQEADLPKEFRAGCVVDSMSELISKLKTTLTGQDEYKSKRREVLDQICESKDGEASKRAALEVINYYKAFSQASKN